jgi:hypothetical protein
LITIAHAPQLPRQVDFINSTVNPPHGGARIDFDDRLEAQRDGHVFMDKRIKARWPHKFPPAPLWVET